MTCHVGTKGEWRYSSYPFLTSALDGSEWSVSRPGHALPLGMDPWYHLDRRLGRPQLVWTQTLEGKSFSSGGDRTLVVYNK
jgi:hypothetical protein